MSGPGSSQRYVVRAADGGATDAAVVGAKFAALARARAAGLPVPPGFAIEIRAFAESGGGGVPEELGVELRAAARELGFDAGFAVRSSATREDLEDGSFAGMYRTLLDVAVDDLPAAVERCWQAAGAAPARAYLDRRGDQPGEAGLGLIVQRMVRARVAGVAFSRNPLRRDGDEVVVEAVAGLGDALASGERRTDAVARLCRHGRRVEERRRSARRGAARRRPAGGAAAARRVVVAARRRAGAAGGAARRRPGAGHRMGARRGGARWRGPRVTSRPANSCASWGEAATT